VLNPSLALPLYQQLADELTAGLQKGDYAVGSRIPSEHELAQRYGLGRPTVRQATEVLVRRGLLERRRGAGTFVSTPREAVDLCTLSGTLAAFEGSGLTLRTRLVEPVRLRDVAKQPGNPFSGLRAYTFKRLGRVDRTPLLLEHLFLDPQVFPLLDELPLARASLSRSIEERYALRPSRGRQTFRVEPAFSRGALLGVTRATPLLVVRRWLDFPNAPSALYAEMICRTDRVELTQTLTPDGST
jgi:GntR family transcriptional regulator